MKIENNLNVDSKYIVTSTSGKMILVRYMGFVNDGIVKYIFMTSDNLIMNFTLKELQELKLLMVRI